MDTIKIILEWAIPFFLTGICAFIAKFMTSVKKNNEVMKEAMKSILRSQIISKSENYLSLGYLPSYARDCLDSLEEQYELLGGNGSTKSLVSQALLLPPKKEGDD